MFAIFSSNLTFQLLFLQYGLLLNTCKPSPIINHSKVIIVGPCWIKRVSTNLLLSNLNQHLICGILCSKVRTANGVLIRYPVLSKGSRAGKNLRQVKPTSKGKHSLIRTHTYALFRLLALNPFLYFKLNTKRRYLAKLYQGSKAINDELIIPRASKLLVNIKSLLGPGRAANLGSFAFQLLSLSKAVP